VEMRLEEAIAIPVKSKFFIFGLVLHKEITQLVM
jgi:hypothetical protein